MMKQTEVRPERSSESIWMNEENNMITQHQEKTRGVLG